MERSINVMIMLKLVDGAIDHINWADVYMENCLSTQCCRWILREKPINKQRALNMKTLKRKSHENKSASRCDHCRNRVIHSRPCLVDKCTAISITSDLFPQFFSSFYFMFLLVPRLKLVFNLCTRYGDQYVSGNICY